MGKTVCIVLGNGFSIDFLHFLSRQKGVSDCNKIDLANLFSQGADLKWPSNEHPGFLSKKYTPNLWDLGARPYLEKSDAMGIIEKIVTSVNVYALKGSNEIEPTQKYLKAYKELSSYLKFLFIDYNNRVSEIPESIENWPWAKFFQSLNEKSQIEEVILISYNYDIWLERVLQKLEIPFDLPPMTNSEGAYKFKLFKPHGSISFKYKEDLPLSSFNINYQELKTDCSAIDIRVQYEGLHTNNPIVFSYSSCW